ncbi:hypothetical protein M0805_004774 [Coniferiporia weirii]|nr:hypothetical protein M0805_004774 [Coniferiporia weirii]
MSSSSAIPTTQRAYVQPFPGGDVKFVNDHPVCPPSALEPGQCLVKLQYSGVCHTDLGTKKNIYPVTPKQDLVGGHEGIGIVVAIGEHTENNGIRLGDRVGIKFMADSCLNCEMCRKGYEGFCSNMKTSGSQLDGTFCEYAVSYVNHVTPIPESLDGPTAAAIMCAGVTVYSALMQCNAHIGDWVVVPGAGGGLGHLAVQYAVAMGLRVIAIDTGAAKRDLCLSLGAEKWIDFRESTNIVADVIATSGGGAHAAIITAGGSSAYEVAAAYLRPAGYLMAVGIPPGGVLSLPVVLIASRGLTIRGVFVGNRQQAIEAVNIAATGRVKCTYAMRDFTELEQVYEEMEKGQVVGRIVLDISK